jgi:hypothetical protein
MLAQLQRVATGRFGPDGFSIDPVMRQIPDHFHAHARDRLRWTRAAVSRPPVPRTTGHGTGTGSGPSPG